MAILSSCICNQMHLINDRSLQTRHPKFLEKRKEGLMIIRMYGLAVKFEENFMYNAIQFHFNDSRIS
jgi:hypothetical protein